MTEREAPPDRGFDYLQDDPYEDDGWFGREQVAEYVSVNEVVPDHSTYSTREQRAGGTLCRPPRCRPCSPAAYPPAGFTDCQDVDSQRSTPRVQ